ncbi:hypothetical protein HMN09_00748800 [Mycena chlorophos]|uniref:Uncharacterized protein n=1 Tax=Mycena chlorophos TaxID=658473 RepID=A0A8H6SV37_MYCCL|nr:hypothetical protein HMN09_00748800 [Mycena chlorophos]
MASSTLAALVFGLVAQTFAFGLFTILVFLSTRSLLRRQERTTPRNVLIFTSFTLYLFSALYWVYSLALIADQISFFTQTVSTSNDGLLVGWLPVVNAAILFNYVLAGGIIVWRARLVCDSTLRQYVFPATGFLVLTAIMVIVHVAIRIVAFLQSPSPIPSTVINALRTVVVALSLASTLNSSGLHLRRRNQRTLNVAFPGGDFQFSGPSQGLALLAESSAVFIFFELLLLISTLVPFQSGTLADVYEPFAVQVAAAYPSALLLLAAANEGVDASNSLSEKIDTRMAPSSPTNLDFKPRSIGGDGGDVEFKPKPVVANVDLPAPNAGTNVDLDNPTAAVDQLNKLAAAEVKKPRPPVMSTEFSMPAPPSRNRSRMGGLPQQPKKRVAFDLGDSTTEGSATPESSIVDLPAGLEEEVAPAVAAAEPEQIQSTVVQRRPTFPRPSPFPVTPQTQPKPEPEPLPIAAPKPSRVPITVGALEYYHKRQEQGMAVKHERTPSQSTIGSLPGAELTVGPSTLARGPSMGQVVVAQGRDHPFPLRSQRKNTIVAQPLKTPTTPMRFSMMPERRDQAALDQLDLDLELVLDSLDTGSQVGGGTSEFDAESAINVPVVEPVVVEQPEEVEPVLSEAQPTILEEPVTLPVVEAGEPTATVEPTEIELAVVEPMVVESTDVEPIVLEPNVIEPAIVAPFLLAQQESAPSTPIPQGPGAGLSFYLDLDSETDGTQTPTQATSPSKPDSMVIPASLVALLPPLPASPTVEQPTELILPVDQLFMAEPIIEPPTPIEQPAVVLAATHGGQRRSALRVAQGRRNATFLDCEGYPEPIPRRVSPQDAWLVTCSVTFTLSLHRALRPASRMNQFPSRPTTPSQSRTGTPTPPAEPTRIPGLALRQRSQSQSNLQRMNQLPSRSQTPSGSRAPTPTLSTSSSSDSLRVAHRRSKSQSSLQRPTDLSPRESIVSSSSSELTGPPRRAPSRPTTPSNSSATGSDVGSAAPQSFDPFAPKRRQSQRRQLKRVKSQPKVGATAKADETPAVAATISAPLSSEEIEAQQERVKAKSMSRFSLDSVV